MGAMKLFWFRETVSVGSPGITVCPALCLSRVAAAEGEPVLLGPTGQDTSKPLCVGKWRGGQRLAVQATLTQPSS